MAKTTGRREMHTRRDVQKRLTSGVDLPVRANEKPHAFLERGNAQYLGGSHCRHFSVV